MNQNALTLITVIRDDQSATITSLLKDKKEALNSALKSIGTVHYARFVIIDSTTINNELLPPQLVLSSNFDGEIDAHIQDLATHLADLLDQIYAHTLNYNPADKAGFLRGIRIKEAAFYVGAPGRSVKDIANEKALHYEIANQLQEGNWSGKSAQEIAAYTTKCERDNKKLRPSSTV